MSTIEIKDNNGIRWLTLNRPDQMNALTVESLVELGDAFDAISTDDNVRCLVISGNSRAFCSGADVEEWARAEASGTLETYGWTEAAHLTMTKLDSVPKPVVAMIHGAAVGAGLDLALCCDFRYASDKAKFKAGYTSMAYSPDAGSSWHLPRIIGLEQSKIFLFYDEVWSAKKALEVGMVTGLFEANDLKSKVEELANNLSAGPTFAYGKIKALLDSGTKNNFLTQLQQEKEAGLLCGRTEDGKEAIKASIEKRKPKFVGR
jgi:2-(1,2-epoxy-1,2-dihydrophenyl)acetyl-CoA isomerase